MRLTTDQQHLIDEHWDTVEKIAAYFHRRHGSRCDWLSEASMGACDAAATYDARRGSAFKSWLYRKSVCACLDAMRASFPLGLRRAKRHGRPAPLLCSLNPDSLSIVDPNSSEYIELIESEDEIRSLAKRLPPKESHVLKRYHLYGESLKAIGRTLDCGESYTSQIRTSALSRLRKSLTKGCPC